MYTQHLTGADLTCTHDLYFEQKKKNIAIFIRKLPITNTRKNPSILHRRVIEMFVYGWYGNNE